MNLPELLMNNWSVLNRCGCVIPTENGIQFEFDKDNKHLELELTVEGDIVWLKDENEKVESGVIKFDKLHNLEPLLKWFLNTNKMRMK